MFFWAAAVLISLIVAATLVLAVYRARTEDPAALSDMQVYRDQLREVDKDLARGILTDDEAETVRIEVSRRLLEADRAANAAGDDNTRGPAFGLAIGAGLFVVAGTLAGYNYLGAPLYPDLPLSARHQAAEEARANRPTQLQAEAQASLEMPPPAQPEGEIGNLIAQLRDVTASRPDDLQGHKLLARNEARLGNFAAARAAQERVVAIQGGEAPMRDLSDLVDLMVLAAGGFVSAETEAVISRVLAQDPGNGTARYYLGLSLAQTGRPDQAFGLWRTLLEESQPDAPWVPAIRAQIEGLAFLSGVDYVLPEEGAAPLRGPSAADIEAAQEMTARDRMVMIEGMVEGLSQRLATEGGPPDDWARLIRAYGVLGRQDAARTIWEEAQTVFPDDITRVPILQAARDAGVAQ